MIDRQTRNKFPVYLTADEARVILDLLDANDCERENDEKINSKGSFNHVDMSACEAKVFEVLRQEHKRNEEDRENAPPKSLSEEAADWERTLWERTPPGNKLAKEVDEWERTLLENVPDKDGRLNY